MSTANERFEVYASLYHKRFGRLAPGKDEGAMSGRNSNDDENGKQFLAWVNSNVAMVDAINRIVELDAEVESLKRQLDLCDCEDNR
jgi:hypothetical protein